jgi:hypothetical protein
MKPSEAMILLSKIASTDKRMAGEAEAHSWAEIMTDNDVPLSDALVAARGHFGSSREYLMPIHIIERVRAIRRERLQRAGTPPMPGDLTRDQERDWAALWCSYVKDGETRDEAEQHAYQTMNIPSAELTANPLRVRRIEALAQSKSIPKEKTA